MLSAEQIVSRPYIGRILLRKHEPDAVRMLANDCFFEFIGPWFHKRSLSIKCLDVVCLLPGLLEHIGQPTLLSLAADYAADEA
jgi:hypothetical protein